MHMELPYGKQKIGVELSAARVDAIEPRFVPGLPDEQAAFRQALAAPLGCAPLAEQLRPGDSVAIAIPDITRALPSERLLSWLFAELPGLPPEQVVIVIG